MHLMLVHHHVKVKIARRVATLPAEKKAGKVGIACLFSVTVKGTLRQALDRKVDVIYKQKKKDAYQFQAQEPHNHRFSQQNDEEHYRIVSKGKK
jgi:hypothetical protein